MARENQATPNPGPLTREAVDLDFDLGRGALASGRAQGLLGHKDLMTTTRFYKKDHSRSDRSGNAVDEREDHRAEVIRISQGAPYLLHIPNGAGLGWFQKLNLRCPVVAFFARAATLLPMQSQGIMSRLQTLQRFRFGSVA